MKKVVDNIKNVGYDVFTVYETEIAMSAKKWSPTDPRHFEGKSLSELQARLRDAEQFAQRFPQFEYGWHNEYRQELRRRIAEQIGRRR